MLREGWRLIGYKQSGSEAALFMSERGDEWVKFEFDLASKVIENEQFADRLRLALKGVGIRPSPTLVANEFNLRYWGKSITSHTARNWLLGKSLPMQDKLRVLADWLHVSPDELRYGTLAPTFKTQEAGTDMSVLTMQDRDMLARYMTLSLAERKTVCDVVAALAVAATVKAR